MADEMPQPADVQRVEGFGLPAFWLPHDRHATAGIVVRSGRSAEPLALAGITHLINHLVAEEFGLDPHGAGSYSDLDICGYSFSGPLESITAYLAGYASVLSVPPTEALQSAIAECQAETHLTASGTKQQLLRLRHGAIGPGSLSFDEYGLRKAGQKQVQNWASRYMHNANAALWFSGPLPTSMRLRLINGVPVRINPASLPIPTPGAAYGSRGEVGLSMMLPRSAATSMCLDLAERRATEELVHRRGACERVTFEILRHGRDEIEVLVLAEPLNDRDDEVLVTLLWLFESLATVPPTHAELDDYRNTYAGLYFHPGLFDIRARDAAIHHLAGIPIDTWPNTYAELDALTVEAVSAVAQIGLQSLLAVAHRECEILEERFAYVGSWLPSLAQGAQFKPIALPGEDTIERELVVGKGGLTLRDGDHISSVNFSECALLIRSDDGYRELISESGSRVIILAQAWEKGAYLIDLIDSQCVPEKTIVLDETVDHRGGYVGAERRRWAR